VDLTNTPPNQAVCPVCTGQPGVLPVVNRQAVASAIKVALALNCSIARMSLFDRKNYFYPDLPKGYQISQYEHPLAADGEIKILVDGVEKSIRIRRVHLEEDTGKLIHIVDGEKQYTLVDLNRAGIPLLEIVSEPDMHSASETLAYAKALRAILRTLGVNSGELDKGVIRFEANVSVRPVGMMSLGTRTEIKNLNSFKSMERAVAFEIERQSMTLERGEIVHQQTLGWEETKGVTYAQREKEDAHDYRYFPEPDLPPLVVDDEWIDTIRAEIPELPAHKMVRFTQDFSILPKDAQILVDDPFAADYFEIVVNLSKDIPDQTICNWITGEIFGWVNEHGIKFSEVKLAPQDLVKLIVMVEEGFINQITAKGVLVEMLEEGSTPDEIVERSRLQQISNPDVIADLVAKVFEENPGQVKEFLDGKENLSNWFFGQVMRAAGGKANPRIVRERLKQELEMARRNVSS
jgi:aspartyl-tRNA(Asn)/glutamyl-tRNA(Gln) amidotransferase subunit B